jgi:hypothetical protein
MKNKEICKTHIINYLENQIQIAELGFNNGKVFLPIQLAKCIIKYIKGENNVRIIKKSKRKI